VGEGAAGQLSTVPIWGINRGISPTRVCAAAVRWGVDRQRGVNQGRASEPIKNYLYNSRGENGGVLSKWAA